jgi:hypothetical protein
LRRVPDELEHRTTLYGTINGEDFKLVGGGKGRPYDGTISTSLRTNPGPVGFKVPVLNMFCVTGFPTFSAYKKGTEDLFKISDGYEYDRVLRFPEGGEIRGVHKVHFEGDNLIVGDFKVEGNVDAPELVGIEPVVETFVPAGKGKVKSSHTVAWKTADGGHFVAHGESEYRLKHDKELPGLQFRHIVFESKHTQETLEQSERLTVVRDIHDLG